MATAHVVLLTPVPTTSVTSGAATVPVSVLVSPRLSGSTALGDYQDWLHWTQRVRSDGLTVTFQCQGTTLDVAMPVAALRPALWDAAFNAETLVRPFAFNDYLERRVVSYSYRLGLSLLKSVYLTSGILHHTLDAALGGDQRSPLTDLLAGLDVRWQPGEAETLRSRYAKTRVSLHGAGPGLGAVPAGAIAADGTIPVPLGAGAASAIRTTLAEPFATYYHPPVSPPLAKDPTDFDTVLDFHQALASLNNYREVQRALGLAFDVELPATFVVPAFLPFGTLSIVGAKMGHGWRTVPTIPAQSSAYVHNVDPAGIRAFFSAPRPSPGEGPRTFAGMLTLPANRFGLAQVDVDGGLMKAIGLAETVIGKPYDRRLVPEDEEGFDDTSALATLRSAGITLFADDRALELLRTFKQSRDSNEAATATPPPGVDTRFFAEELIRGYRLDVWDSVSETWRSLHARNAAYSFADQRLPPTAGTTIAEEGFVELAATTPSTKDGTQASTDLYLHEAIARWGGWSLSAPRSGKALSRHGDPAKALDSEPLNPASTPFQVRPEYTVTPGTLPSLRFGRAYRMRARLVDLAGNGLSVDSPLAAFLAAFVGLPLRPEGLPYLRFQPVLPPVLVARSTDAVRLPGSAINRIVIRTFNKELAHDGVAAVLTANDRHVAPPRVSVELAEQLGMLDAAAGHLNGSAAMWQLLADRDKGDFEQSPPFELAGQKNRRIPLEPAATLADLPYLPDVLARGAAFRDLPESGSPTRGRVAPGGGAEAPVAYVTLDDPNPRAGSATLVSFGGEADWQEMRPFRFALAEGMTGPRWDPANRLFTAFLPKGTTKTVLMSSYLEAEDLKLMGVWQWIREGIELGTIFLPTQQQLFPGADQELVAHILQRAVEGGHWMLSPPRVLKLVHAVQQPIGRPEFVPLTVRRAEPSSIANPLVTMPELDPTLREELATLTAWRRSGSTDTWLLGGLRVHGASTDKVDLHAEWTDPVDDLANPAPTTRLSKAIVDEVPLPSTKAVQLRVPGADYRLVGRYDPPHDTICFLRHGDMLGSKAEGVVQYLDAAPRHQIGDARHHVVRYTAVATSRYREYFDPKAGLDFTRPGLPADVHVPAAARPAAPHVRYVVPTFGWQRETSTNVKRSVRFGGGLRVYLDRPWYSSGADEHLGVVCAPWGLTLTDDAREEWKTLITQWGQDPIWRTAPLTMAPSVYDFHDAAIQERGLPLEERSALAATAGTADVAAFPVHYDADRRLWYGDLIVGLPNATYGAFIRLALVRYQPYALREAKVSRVVLADFAQLTPDRSAVVSADPYAPRTLRVTVTGVAPQGPVPVLDVAPLPRQVTHRPTQIRVRAQRRRTDIAGELGWEDAPATEATVTVDWDAAPPGNADLTHWTGRVQFDAPPAPGAYRLLIEEREYISANHTFVERGARGRAVREQPSRLIYAEVFELDHALIHGPEPVTGTEV